MRTYMKILASFYQFKTIFRHYDIVVNLKLRWAVVFADKWQLLSVEGHLTDLHKNLSLLFVFIVGFGLIH